ncbi:MAG: hypothetical protein R3E32_03065 [Chitinophagales bacterium]
MKKKIFGARQVLAFWNIGLLLYFIWQVKFVEARYILMLIPTMLILASALIFQIWKWLANLSISDYYITILKRLLLVILVLIFGTGIQQWVNWSKYHRNREHTNASIIAGKWLSENVVNDCTIYCDETSYIPDTFSKIFREKQCRLSKISELQTDIIMFVDSRYTQFEDSTSVHNFLLEEEKFWDIHYFYHAFQDSVYQNYHLWKDFRGVRIFKRN